MKSRRCRVNYSEFRIPALEAVTLKNIITLALLLSLAAVVTSCSGDSGDAPQATPGATQATPGAAETAPEGDQTAADAPEAAPEAVQATPDAPGDAAAGKHNFRVPVWGMTMDEIVNVEGTNPKNRTEDKINYETFIGGHGVFIDYQFDKGKLVRESLIFPEVKEDKNDYIREFRDIKDKFSAQYGQPVIDSSKNLTGEDIPNAKKGDAVCEGKLVYGAQWDLPGTTARLVLNSYKSQCTLVMMYAQSGGNNGL